MPFGSRLKQARKRKGLTQKDVADHLGINTSAVGLWETDKAHPSSSRYARLSELLGVTVEWLIRGGDDDAAPEAAAPIIPPNAKFLPASETISIAGLPRDVPVLGIATCGEDGTFFYDSGGDPIDYVRRPPRLFGVREAYALYCQGESMKPWREQGQLVYVVPRMPVVITDYVAVQLRSDEHPVEGIIKRLVKRTASHIHLEQYNPPKVLKIPVERVVRMDKILDWSELMGI